jgi:hypothetical protein
MRSSRVFESDLFGSMKDELLSSITAQLEKFEQSAPLVLRERCQLYREVALKDAAHAIKKTFKNVDEMMTKHQKTISRSFSLRFSGVSRKVTNWRWRTMELVRSRNSR